MMIYIYITLLSIIKVCACQSTTEAEFVINFDSQIEPCSDESSSFVNTSKVKVGRYNETHSYMYGEIEFFKQVGSDTMMEIIIEKEAAGKSEVLFSHEICDLCAEIGKANDSDYYDYLKYFGVPDACPIEPGEYPIKDFILNTEDVPINSNTCGRYLLFLNLYKNPEKDCKTSKEFLCCLTISLLIERAD